jgi:hypothetical protein
MSDNGGLETGAAGADAAECVGAALAFVLDGGLEEEGAGTVGPADVGPGVFLAFPLPLLDVAAPPADLLEPTCCGRRGGDGDADERGEEAREDISARVAFERLTVDVDWYGARAVD